MTGLHYEILIRLRDQGSQLGGPGGFLPVAETFRFMLEIDQWLTGSTFRSLSESPQWLRGTAKCAINLAGTPLSNGEFVPFIADQLKRKAICEVAQSMNLRTIAEFVEGEELTSALKELGVDYGQGFGIAKPRPLHELFQ